MRATPVVLLLRDRTVSPAALDSEDYFAALDSIYDDTLDGCPSTPATTDFQSGLEPRLARHRERAGRIKSELTALRACRQMLAAGLHLIGVAVFVVNDERRVVFANAAAEALRDDGTLLTISDGALVATSRATDVKLQMAIGAALGRRASPEGVYILLQHPERPLAAIVLPTAHGPGASATAIVLVSDPLCQLETGLDVLVRTHGLTPAEARLMTALTKGDGLVAVAAQLGISSTTARTHLKSIFAKTRTERQSELMRLVATLAPPTRRPQRG